MTITSSPRQATTTAPSRDQRTLNATVNTFAAGMTRSEAIPYAIVCMHIGPSVEVVCDRGGKLRHGREVAGWAIKADIDSGGAGGQLFRESLGTALAARLLQRHNRRSLPMRDPQGGLSAWKLKLVISHIEDNLESELSLAEIAKVAGVSVSHLKTQQATTLPASPSVIRSSRRSANVRGLCGLHRHERPGHSS